MAESGSNSTTSSSSEATAGCSTSQSMSKGNEDKDIIEYTRQAIDSTISKCVSSFRLSSIVKNYPSIKKKNFERLKSLHESYKQQLLAAVNTEVDHVIEKENVEKLLSGFQEIHRKNAKHHKRKAWRPSGDPRKDISAHVIPSKMRYKEALQKHLHEIEQEKTQLSWRLQQRRQHLITTNQQISEKREELKKNMLSLNTSELSEFINAERGSTSRQNSEDGGLKP